MTVYEVSYYDSTGADCQRRFEVILDPYWEALVEDGQCTQAQAAQKVLLDRIHDLGIEGCIIVEVGS